MNKWMMGVAAGLTGWSLMAGAQTSTPATPRTPLPRPGVQSPVPGTSVSATPAPADVPRTAGPLPAVQFPPVDPKAFTTATPSPQTVDSFLHAVWGLEENRVWRVAGVQPANVPGFVRVDVYVADKRDPGRIGSTAFFVTPDGKHAVTGELAPFGATPFAEIRAALQQRADGPAEGAAGKDLEFVEFNDLQCANCKVAHATVEQLAHDFPQAHVVFENLPASSVHPFAVQAAAVGNCVRQAKGDAAFFVYAQKVFDTQADLVAGKGDATLQAAVTAAGADPTAAMTCASQPAARAAVEASVKLANDLGVNTGPTLVINGRVLSLAQRISYPALKQAVVFQGQLDGLTVKEQPSLSNLH